MLISSHLLKSRVLHPVGVVMEAVRVMVEAVAVMVEAVGVMVEKVVKEPPQSAPSCASIPSILFI